MHVVGGAAIDPSRGPQAWLSQDKLLCGRGGMRWRNLKDGESAYCNARRHEYLFRLSNLPFLNLRVAMVDPNGDLSHHDYFVSEDL